MDCSLPGPSIHGIFQARVLERGAIAFSDIHTAAAAKYKIINRDLLYSTGDSPIFCKPTWEQNVKKNTIYVKLNHFAIHLKYNIVDQLYSNIK